MTWCVPDAVNGSSPRSRRRGRALGVFALCCLVAAATTHAAVATDSERWNVLLITVDCLRPDHMSLYGYERDTTPHLSAFAKEALVFDKAFSTSAWTSPGIISLLTGYYPPVHAQTGRYSFYDSEMASPLRVLVDEGYRTFGRSNEGPTYANLGLERELKPDVKESREQLENLIESWSAEDAPFFAWAHIRQTHLPYTPSEKHANQWIDTSATSAGIDAVRNYQLILRNRPADFPYRDAGEVAFTDEDIPVIRALYDGEVADADDQLGQVLQRMRETGLLDRTIVIITADHAEELFEHGWLGHASTSYDGKLYDELIHVPLLIRLPRQEKTGRYDALVQGVDVMPTVFDLLGLDQGRVQPAMQGQSLLPIISGEEEEIHSYVFNETTRDGWTTPQDEMKTRVVSVRSKDKKLIRFPEDNGYRTEAYDLREDPGEQTNIYPDRAAEFADLERALQDWGEDNRRVSAQLVQSAADRQLVRLKQALAEGDLMDATERWQDIEVMNQTWGQQVDPFYEHDPFAETWRDTLSQAAGLIAEAMGCVSRGGGLGPGQAENGSDASVWTCQN